MGKETSPRSWSLYLDHRFESVDGKEMASDWMQQALVAWTVISLPFKFLWYLLVWVVSWLVILLSWLLSPLSWLVRVFSSILMMPVRFLARFEVRYPSMFCPSTTTSHRPGCMLIKADFLHLLWCSNRSGNRLWPIYASDPASKQQGFGIEPLHFRGRASAEDFTWPHCSFIPRRPRQKALGKRR